MSETSRFFLLLFTVVIFFLFYSANFSAPFYFTDDQALIEIPQLSIPFSLKLWRVLFTPGYHLDFYPLRDWSYWLDIHLFPLFFKFSIGGLGTSIFRLHNALLFISTAAGLFAILRLLTVNESLSLALVVLWFLNPYHYETVWWISARKDLLALNYFVWSTVAWLKFEKSQRITWGILSLTLFIFSLFSKTSFLLTPLALLLYLFRKRSFRLPFVLVSLACLISVVWGFIQSWHYSEVVDMRFFYPWSYRFQASLSALGRMVLGVFFSEVNALDTYNFGEWLSLNKKFLWLGVSFFGLMIGASFWALKNSRLFLLLSLFWVTYLPVSGLLFKHLHFYSVRYFEPGLIVLIIGLALGLNKYSALIRAPIRNSCFLFFALYFSVGLFLEKNNWTSNLQIIKKAMTVTPGNPALNTYFLHHVEDLNSRENPTVEGTKLTEAIKSSLYSQCLPKIESESERGSVSTLCERFVSLDYWPQKQFDSTFTPREKIRMILDWEAKTLALRHNTSIEVEKEKQWALRFLILEEMKSPPKKRPFLTNEDTRRAYLAALYKQDSKSGESLKLQKEWEELGVLQPGFDVLQELRLFEELVVSDPKSDPSKLHRSFR